LLAVFPPEAGKFDPPGNSLGWDVHQISCKPEKRRSRPIITSVNLCSEPFLWLGWWFLPSDFFISHQRHRAAFGYIQANIGNRAKENT